MSVKTTADENRDKAKEYVEKAHEYLLRAIDPETWGSNEFNDEYVAKMEKSILRLIKIKRDL